MAVYVVSHLCARQLELVELLTLPVLMAAGSRNNRLASSCARPSMGLGFLSAGVFALALVSVDGEPADASLYPGA
jgi:hypothetical protein